MMINNESERKEIYDQMSKNEQWLVDNELYSNLNYEDWSNELYLLNCPIGHEWEYRYHYSEGGVLQLFNQCTSCGKKADKGGSLKHSTIDNFKEKVIRGEIKKYDEDLFNKYDPSYTNYNKFCSILFYEERNANKKEWFKQHNEYLLTDQWKAIRLKVLKRDNYLCQGCLEATATEVHHLTYNHWKNELMFELLSVCYDCHHNKIHRK